jgi:hypothetical protein
MGTNYYRIASENEINERREKMLFLIRNIDFSAKKLKENIFLLRSTNPWEEFITPLNVHLGKRSSGWKFVWNFHNNKYYKDKEELFKFIHNGQIIDEYGTVWDNEEFIKMAINWNEPDGLIYDSEYRKKEIKKYPFLHHLSTDIYDNKIIDGLVVSSSIDFS